MWNVTEMKREHTECCCCCCRFERGKQNRTQQRNIALSATVYEKKKSLEISCWWSRQPQY